MRSRFFVAEDARGESCGARVLLEGDPAFARGAAREEGDGEFAAHRLSAVAAASVVLQSDFDGDAFGGQLLLAVCGAALFAANVAPTEEIVLIAVESSWTRLFALACASLLLGSLILHYSEFRGAQEFVRRGSTGAVVLGTVITYAVALFASALILWFFGRFDDVSLYTALAQTVVLGVPATLGASAGRLLLQ